MRIVFIRMQVQKARPRPNALCIKTNTFIYCARVRTQTHIHITHTISWCLSFNAIASGTDPDPYFVQQSRWIKIMLWMDAARVIVEHFLIKNVYREKKKKKLYKLACFSGMTGAYNNKQFNAHRYRTASGHPCSVNCTHTCMHSRQSKQDKDRKKKTQQLDSCLSG